ncbi:MAG: ABC transporter permease [Deltaproteobacteria bacterium]|nr:ABC transporter permease [Deltaproteobacteria bacterium]MCK5187858.1 ABC transporter permease [Deltaproteobacteria bacterium]
MKLPEIMLVSLEGLKANTLRTVLTILGVIIGVLAIVLLISLSLEVSSQVAGNIKSLGSNLFFVFPADPQSNVAAFVTSKLRPKHARDIEQKSSYNIAASSLINKTAVVKYGKKSRGTTVVTGSLPNLPYVRDWEVVKGRFIKKSDLVSNRKVCVICQEVNRDLFRSVDPIGRNLVINGRNFKIIGVMAKKGLFFNINLDDQVFIPLTTAQRFFNTSELNFIMVKVINANHIGPSMAETERILAKHLSENDFYVQSQGQTLDIFYQITSILTIMLGAIATISLVVGGIGIMNIMTVAVTERTKEIGIRKAVGAKDSDILLQFLAEAMLISLMGGLIGIIISYAVAYLISFFYPTFNFSISHFAVLLAVIFAFSIGTFFGVYPAYKASNLDPITALHYE